MIQIALLLSKRKYDHAMSARECGMPILSLDNSIRLSDHAMEQANH
jgi:hypothetical protein